MKHYSLFLLVASVTVLSPGPGVVMSLTNALRYGLRGTFGGILGIAVGALMVAAISATSLGVLLATSALAAPLETCSPYSGWPSFRSATWHLSTSPSLTSPMRLR